MPHFIKSYTKTSAHSYIYIYLSKVVIGWTEREATLTKPLLWAGEVYMGCNANIRSSYRCQIRTNIICVIEKWKWKKEIQENKNLLCCILISRWLYILNMEWPSCTVLRVHQLSSALLAQSIVLRNMTNGSWVAHISENPVALDQHMWHSIGWWLLVSR